LVIPFRPAPADRHRRCVHGGAFDFAVCRGNRFVPDALWFPPLIEMLIAAAILCRDREHHRQRDIAPLGARLRVWADFRLRLLASAARDHPVAGDHTLTGLLSFEFGVELEYPAAASRAGA
jgi:hypothetical protein